MSSSLAIGIGLVTMFAIFMTCPVSLKVPNFASGGENKMKHVLNSSSDKVN